MKKFTFDLYTIEYQFRISFNRIIQAELFLYKKLYHNETTLIIINLKFQNKIPLNNFKFISSKSFN